LGPLKTEGVCYVPGGLEVGWQKSRLEIWVRGLSGNLRGFSRVGELYVPVGTIMWGLGAVRFLLG